MLLEKKYFHVFKITIQEYLIYRLSFFLWRFRNLVLVFSLYFFWLAVFKSQETVFGYQQSQIIVYVTVVALLKNLIFSTRTQELAGMIRSGDLTRILLNPVNIFKLYLSRDLADKFLNVIFSIGEIFLLFKLLGMQLDLQTSFPDVALFILAMILSFFLNFFINLFLSFLAFWTEDIWATRWLFGIIFLEFFSGAVFPLEVLPPWLRNTISLTPFPYLIFYPAKILMGQLSPVLMVKSLVISFVWLLFFGRITYLVWQKGIKNYGAYGG